MTSKAEILLLTDYLKEISPEFLASKLILLYEGEVNHEIIKSILLTLESSFEHTNINRQTQKKVFNIVVECIQNIEKHTISLASVNYFFTKRGSILLLENENNIEIYSGNLVNQEQKSFLLKKEMLIKNKTREELREIYKQQLVEGAISKKGGAGLGFLDMARKSNNNIEFYFFNTQSNLEYFIYKIIINKN
ncbi:MAG TPA: SiaB family protein kinase [Bacteroidales bacterium]|jgi:hypothetical protein|nr:SiaB family protein kinase [Bacteroidales bacterium]